MPHETPKNPFNDVTYRTDRKCVRPSADGHIRGSTLHNPNRLHSAKLPDVHDFSISPRAAAPESYICLDVPNLIPQVAAESADGQSHSESLSVIPLAFFGVGKLRKACCRERCAFPNKLQSFCISTDQDVFAGLPSFLFHQLRPPGGSPATSRIPGSEGARPN